jgi:dipeptidase
MCDTIVAIASATKDGVTLFGKNSDREPDEVQNIVIIPRKQHKPGESVKCTYITIPQATETARVLLSQPFWMFGAEMGANEYGVTIGNEAVFTRVKPSASGLTGMDLLRLGLERGKTAKQAMDTIISLLEEYGQGGNCGYRQPFLYMNSYIIADPSEAYVLECVKRWWAWKKIESTWSISNVLSLGSDFDACSPGLIEHAVKKGWCKGKDDFDLRRCYSDPVITWGAAAKPREACSRAELQKKQGSLTTADFMAILRHHGGREDFRPDRHGGTVCMHAADKLIRRSQSVASLVGNLAGNRQYYYMTGASSPCIRPFFPVFGPGTATPAGYLEGKAEYDRESYWWDCERLHRRGLKHHGQASASIQPQIAAYEKEMLQEVETLGLPPNQTVIDHYFQKARALVTGHEAAVHSISKKRADWLYSSYWQGFDKANKVE